MSNLMGLIWGTFRDPRGGLRYVLNQPISKADRWQIFALAVILPTILIGALLLTVPVPEDEILMLSPIALTVTQGFGMMLMVCLAHWVGRARGGNGTFAEALLAVSWFQIVIVFILFGVLLVELALPMVATIIVIAATLLIFWILTNFVAELHGFTSLPMTFLGIIVTVVAANFVVALIIAPFMGVGNV